MGGKPGRHPVGEKPVFGPDEPWIGGAPMRCCCRARALCSRSGGRLLTLAGGRLALFKIPATLELGLIVLFCCGSETVRSDGTLRGSSSGLALGGSSGVLASEESSSELGEAGLLAENSSGVSGDEMRWSSAMANREVGVVLDVRLCPPLSASIDLDMCCQDWREGSRLFWPMTWVYGCGVGYLGWGNVLLAQRRVLFVDGEISPWPGAWSAGSGKKTELAGGQPGRRRCALEAGATREWPSDGVAEGASDE